VTARSLRLIAASTQYLSRTAVQANNTATVLAGWVRIASYPASGYAMIAGLSRAFTGAALQINTTGQLSLRDYNTEGVTAGSTLALDRWYYLWFRVPLGLGTSSVYLDGNVVPDASRTVTYASGSNPLLRLGARYNAPTSPFDGWFARWRMWAADISASQVRVERYALRAMQRASLVGDWWMDGSPDVYDHGGAGRTLSVTGGPLSPSGVILGEFRPARRVVVRVTAGGAVQLVVQNASVGIAAEGPALVQKALLTVADAGVGITAESPSLLPKHTLVAADAAIAITADSPALTQANLLAVADADVAITADTVALTQQALLTVADALIAIAADSPSLAQKNLLAVADSTVGIDAENITLSNATLLVVADALVAIAAEAPALAQKNLLAIQDALVAIGAEAPSLTQANVLAVQGADVAITVDPITLSNAILLAVADTAVAITVDGIALSPANTLAVQDALLAITADSPGLVQANVLAVNDALVAVTVGGLVLVLPAEATTGKYAPEHAAALAALGEARSFAADHAGAFRDIGAAGSG
jgi:hypothetical protein